MQHKENKQPTDTYMEGATVPILVTGGTGTLGRLLVRRLLDEGRQVTVLTRRQPEPSRGVEFVTGDLGSDEGIDAAVQGIHTIVHLAGSAKGDEDKARNLVRAASKAGVRHLVHISVVGADRIPVASKLDRNMFGYFESKLEAERAVMESGIPWTVLRATQFNDLVLMVLQQMAKLPVVPLPKGMRVQPVEAAEVAERLAELALGLPKGLVPDLAGPKVYDIAQLMSDYLQFVQRRRLILPVVLPGKAARAMVSGANLAPERAVGSRTWEEFLIQRQVA
ncbi:SDR family oxidoreductase [Arthrobacter pigmenti]